MAPKPSKIIEKHMEINKKRRTIANEQIANERIANERIANERIADECWVRCESMLREWVIIRGLSLIHI